MTGDSAYLSTEKDIQPATVYTLVCGITGVHIGSAFGWAFVGWIGRIDRMAQSCVCVCVCVRTLLATRRTRYRLQVCISRDPSGDRVIEVTAAIPGRGSMGSTSPTTCSTHSLSTASCCRRNPAQPGKLTAAGYDFCTRQ